MKTPRQIVEDAIDLLNEKGWCQNLFHDDDGAFCLAGALLHAAECEPGQLLPQRSVAEAIDARLGEGYVTIWNDAPGRTKDEVLALLKDVYSELPL